MLFRSAEPIIARWKAQAVELATRRARLRLARLGPAIERVALREETQPGLFDARAQRLAENLAAAAKDAAESAVRRRASVEAELDLHATPLELELMLFA